MAVIVARDKKRNDRETFFDRKVKMQQKYRSFDRIAPHAIYAPHVPCAQEVVYTGLYWRKRSHGSAIVPSKNQQAKPRG